MKRIALLAAAALASGCVAEDPFGDVAVYWSFLRHTDAGGVTYDCAQAGVDYVIVTDLGGYSFDPFDYYPGIPGAVPCVFYGVEGATFVQFPTGIPQTFVVHAYRDLAGAPDVEVFSGQGTVTVGGGRLNPLYVTVPGTAAPLELNAYLYNTSSPGYYPDCASATIDTLSYDLYDGNGTIVTSSQVACTGNTPVLFYSASPDLDNHFVRVAGYQGAILYFDSCSQAFNHYGSQTGGSGVAVTLDTPVPACP